MAENIKFSMKTYDFCEPCTLKKQHKIITKHCLHTVRPFLEKRLHADFLGEKTRF